MWLLPALTHLSALAARVYYRLTVAGARVPADGPVLLVANHPNALFDPALVAVAAERPVRFLAKAPLLTDRAVGWLVRGVGAIPVFRPMDDPTQVGRNDASFRATHAALAEGAAVGIFPEGVSHSHPALVPLKTGAARIALGAAELHGAAFPIIPIGLSYRAKHRFRSEAIAVVGDPIAWNDIVEEAGESRPLMVRELTSRIYDALLALTLNLERWEDAPLVEAAASIYTAEFGGDRHPARQVEHRRRVTAVLARLRAENIPEWEPAARRVIRHARMLELLGIEPEDLREDTGPTSAPRWVLHLSADLLMTGLGLLVGAVLFYIPYRATGSAVALLRPTPDVVSTLRTFGGALFFILWIILLATLAGMAAGIWIGIAALVILPPLALLTLSARDRFRELSATAWRLVLLRRRKGLQERLRERQREIAVQLRSLHRTVGT